MSLLDHRLLLTAGKGGVGRSTVTAAVALVAAARGKKVLVCEVNTKERISALLGVRPVGEQIGPLAENLEAVVVRPREALREYALMQLKYRAIYNAVFENRWVSRFLRFVPSINEVTMLGKILYHVREQRWDVVLVDAPATGHGITFLRVAHVIADTVPPGPLRRDAEWMRDLLVDGTTTAVNLVSIPEELPVNETVELAEAVSSLLRMKLGTVFLNCFTEPRFGGAERQALATSHADPLLERAAEAARAHSHRADLSTKYRDKLRVELELPIVDIPFLPPAGEFGRQDIDHVARVVDAGLT